MSNTPDTTSCVTADINDGPQTPFTSLSYHFGMLLGVTDFETDQAYHRGKMWLHNAWLHRQGVVWGFDVQLDTAHHEIRVKPGFAIDAMGRELHLEQDACLNVPAWFSEHRDELTVTTNGSVLSFDAHLVIQFKSCLTRQVPALSEPCEGGETTTAYSRVFETVEIFLRPGLADVPVPPYHRLRLLFGIDEPLMENGTVVEADREVLDAPKNLASFRRFAALDGIDLQPPDGQDALPVVLANITGISLTDSGDTRTLTAGEVDVSVRPSHVATQTVQELLCEGAFNAPFVVPDTVTLDSTAETVSFQVSTSLAPNSVHKDAFKLTHYTPTDGWVNATVNAAAYDDGSKVVTVEFNSFPAVGAWVRFMVDASGPKPPLGTNLSPLNNGTDFVHSQERTSS
jgi:hypothetical protein